MSNVVKKFLSLIAHDTTSDENSNTFPSTASQLQFAQFTADLCRNIGLSDVTVSKHGYVYAKLPSNSQDASETIGFIAHMDTSADFPGANIKPRIIENYDGYDITLNDEKNIVMSVSEFPVLKDYKDRTLIVTDGTTLLGGDDKAGMAEILEAMDYLIKNPEIKHHNIVVGFTPDEEIGKGADAFDVDYFGADYAYTVDGGEIGCICYETFSAAKAVIDIYGKSIHPGAAKGIMKNAGLIAGEFIGMLPSNQTPATTEGYEGFYHLCDVTGDVASAKLVYILRDFVNEGLTEKKDFIKTVADTLNNKYGKGTVAYSITDQYSNMYEILKDKKYIVDRAEAAMRNLAIEPFSIPLRGGTDGSRLTFMGLSCPNLFTGGHNPHGPYEFIVVESMDAAVQLIVEISKY